MTEKFVTREIGRATWQGPESELNARLERKPAVKVKPLVWQRGAAATKFGRYLLVEQEDGGDIYWYIMFERRTVTTAGIHATEDDAKAAAQADHDRRILASLEGGEA